MYKNPSLPKLLTPGQKKFQAEIFEVCRDLVANKGYIKGYGKEDRLMTESHSPLRNIDRKITKQLLLNGLIIKDNLIFIPSQKAHTILKQNQITIHE